jgi:hypothetical protein
LTITWDTQTSSKDSKEAETEVEKQKMKGLTRKLP